jgi:putative flippase GtrA
MRSIDRRFVRFIVVGGFNTAVGYLVYGTLLVFVSYRIAYTVSYIFGVLLSYYLNARFVFESRRTLSGLARFPLVYVAQYLFGLTAMWLLVQQIGVSKWLAPLIVVGASVPLTFLLARLLLLPDSRQADG